jgi:hypothetical protein
MNSKRGEMPRTAPSPAERRPHNREVLHCIRGHPLSGDNLKVVKPRDGFWYRRCRACDRLRKQQARRQEQS